MFLTVKIAKNLQVGISLITVQSTIKRNVHKGHGWKQVLNGHDLQALMELCIKTML